MILHKKYILLVGIFLFLVIPTETIFAQELHLSGWLPYWAKTLGVQSATKNIQVFDEILPFAFEVQPDGSIKDAPKIDSDPWPKLIKAAKKNNVDITPTFLWTGPTAMKNVFTDSTKTEKHINDIVSIAKKMKAKSVDIDYEGKRMSDKAIYADFFKKLSLRLKKEGITLSCTIEATATSSPSADLLRRQATSPWSNDLVALNTYCDVVRVMAYDQMPQTTTSEWTAYDKVPYAPNADIAWVRQVVEYNLKYISREKLLLGVPTYGWDTQYTKNKNGTYSYDIMKSVSYPQGKTLAKELKIKPQRDSTGGLRFLYSKDGKDRVVYFADAQSIQMGIDIAKDYNLKGVTLFKIDGNEDPKMWKVLKNTKQ